MSLINIKIEGYPYQVEEGLTILEAAKRCGYEIPSLCAYNHGECNNGSCRVCLVEATGARGLVASCVYPVSEGMEITISSPKAVEARRTSVELLLSNHSMKCQQCSKNGSCELLHVAKITGAREDKYQASVLPSRSTSSRRPSFAIPANAFSAADASQDVKTLTVSAFSALRIAASAPSSLPPKIAPLPTLRAYSAVSA